MAGFIATSLGDHLRLFNAVPVFILSPRSGAAHAARLYLVGVRVHLEFPAGVAGSAPCMSFHFRLSRLLEINGGCLSASGQFWINEHLPFVHCLARRLERRPLARRIQGIVFPLARSLINLALRPNRLRLNYRSRMVNGAIQNNHLEWWVACYADCPGGFGHGIEAPINAAVLVIDRLSAEQSSPLEKGSPDSYPLSVLATTSSPG